MQESSCNSINTHERFETGKSIVMIAQYIPKDKEIINKYCNFGKPLTVLTLINICVPICIFLRRLILLLICLNLHSAVPLKLL